MIELLVVIAIIAFLIALLLRMFPYETKNFSAFLTPQGGETVNLSDT